MSIPDLLQNLISRGLEIVRSDPKHLLPPTRRQEIYDAFIALSPDQPELPRRWLDILAVKYVLPLWGTTGLDWPAEENYPTPRELLTIEELRMFKWLKEDEYEERELLAAEMVSSTSEHPASPFYPIWCVFEAAVSMNFIDKQPPKPGTTDEDWLKNWPYDYDVAKLALVAHAGRVESDIKDPKELHEIWDRDYCETDIPDRTILPWQSYFDTQACLTFWEWWLEEAVPKAWELANKLPLDKPVFV